MDADFLPDTDALRRAVELLASIPTCTDGSPDWPQALPQTGIGPRRALEQLAPVVLGGAARLGAPTAFAHMDPPTPWITWATTLWNAALNQNLLHPATAPVARRAEQRVVGWLAPYFGMDGGHMTPGSTVANLTALWAARDQVGVDEVVASEAAHLSIAKAAHLLGLRYRALPADREGALRPEALVGDLGRSALVLTAGTTSTGVIDPLALAGRAAWTHVDAAWAGPLRLSSAHAALLDGITDADSVAVSAHKWLFQPKESALVMFRATARAHAALSFGGDYLACPNIGLLGSHGAAAIPLLATLLAWGREGLATRIEYGMRMADQLAEAIVDTPNLELLALPRTGIVVWRPRDRDGLTRMLAHLPEGTVSTTTLGGERWLRCVAANPNADLDGLVDAVRRAAAS